MDKKKLIKGSIITLIATGVGYFLYKKVKDFSGGLRVSIGSFDIDLRKLFTEGLKVYVKTFVDNNASLQPTITGLVVEVFYNDGKAYQSLGVSRPLQSPIKLNTGRNEVLTTLDISVITSYKPY
jgi:hypothetical protein